jgi:hypothetical protein
MNFKIPVLLLLLSWVTQAFPQATVGKYKLPAIVVEGDTIPVITLRPVNVIDFANPDMLEDVQAYYRLRFNVIKVYPYARLAALKIRELNSALDTMPSKKARKKFTKEFEKQLKADFEVVNRPFSVLAERRCA